MGWRITRGNISARWGAKTSRAVRESIVRGSSSFIFVYYKNVRSVLFVFYRINIITPTKTIRIFTKSMTYFLTG